MEVEIKKLGNSLVFRIPKNLQKILQISEGQTLDLELVEQGILLKTKRRRSRIRLEDMLENLGSLEELDWGESAGEELW